MQSNSAIGQDSDRLEELLTELQQSSIGFEDKSRLRVESDHFVSRFGDNCASSLTHYHDLVCGHTINANPNGLADLFHKFPCGPTCTRYSTLSTMGFGMQVYRDVCYDPFLCPVCVENWVRDNFSRFNQHHFVIEEVNSTRIREEQEDEIRFWVYCLISKLTSNPSLPYQMRLAQGLDGVFKFEYQSSYNNMNSPKDEIVMTPNFRPASHAAGGSFASMQLQQFKPRASSGRSAGFGDGRLDHESNGWNNFSNEDGDINLDIKGLIPAEKDWVPNRGTRQTTVVAKKTYGEQTLNNNIDELAERLLDVRIGQPKGDALMEKLLGDLGLLGLDHQQ